jgi:5-methylcytosine-specific restriction endonuclease McrA
MTISAGLRRAVTQRAGDRCEYCGLSQAAQEALFHVDHIIPRVADGPTVLENLGLACVSCSLRKGARLSATDPNTGLEANLFNPRRDRWHDHFGLDGLRIIG